MTTSKKELIWSAIITGAFGQLVAWVYLDMPAGFDRMTVATVAGIAAGLVWAVCSTLHKARCGG